MNANPQVGVETNKGKGLRNSLSRKGTKFGLNIFNVFAETNGLVSGSKENIVFRNVKSFITNADIKLELRTAFIKFQNRL